MRDEPYRTRPAGPATLLAALVMWGAASPAPAQNLHGYAQLQYQKLENSRVIDPMLEQEYWVTAFQMDYATRLRPDLSLNAQVQFSNLDYTGRAEGSQVPYGMLRLTHPIASVTGLYRRQLQTDAEGVTSRQKQAVVTGRLAPPGLPRLDVSWIRRRLDPYGRVLGSTGLTRTGTLGYDVGALSLQGGYTDIVQNPDDPAARRTSQRTWNGGSSYMYASPRQSVSLQYGFSESRRGDSRASDAARTHDAAVGAGRKLSSKTNVSLNYSFRRTRVSGAIEEKFNDNNGSLLLSYAPSRPFSFATGAGVRTARTDTGQSTEKYAVATASATGTVRPGWTGGANATYSQNWTPDGLRHHVNSYGARTAMRLWRGMDVAGGAQASLNDRMTIAPGDSVARPLLGRVVTQTNVGANATPLHGISVGYTYSLYRVGESLTGSANASRTAAWTALWSPMRTLRLEGSRSRSRGLGSAGQSFLTSRANAQWDVSPGLQLTGAYTQSESPRRASDVQDLPARKLVSVRALAAVASDLQANAGMSWVDPGTDRAVRQLDVSLTQRFSY